MCGIVAYIGDKYADSVLWTGLERLQYRGYDSAGMAIISDGEIDLRKRAGKLRELDESLPAESDAGCDRYRSYSLGNTWGAE